MRETYRTDMALEALPRVGDQEGRRLIAHQLQKYTHFTPREAGMELGIVTIEYEALSALTDPLARLKADREEQVFLLLVEVPSTELREARVQEALATIAELGQQGDGIIAGALLVDRQHVRRGTRGSSDVTGGVGPLVHDRKMRMLARSLMATIHQHKHHEQNGTGSELFSELLKQHPYCGVVVGSIGLDTGEALAPLHPARWFSSRVQRGRGDVDHTASSVVHLGKRLLTDERGRLFPIPLDVKQHSLIGQTLAPFRNDRPHERGFWDFCERLEASELPGSRLIFISAGGEPDGSVGTHYYAQFAWFYGFDEQDLTRLREQQDEQREPQGSDPHSGAGQRERVTPLRALPAPTSSNTPAESELPASRHHRGRPKGRGRRGLQTGHEQEVMQEESDVSVEQAAEETEEKG